MIYNEEPHKIQKINDKLITLNQKVSNYNTDFNSKATEAHYNKGKKVYTYESEWITLQPSPAHSLIPYALRTAFYWDYYYYLYQAPYIPQLFDSKEFSARAYYGEITMSPCSIPPECFITWYAIFKTAPEYQNQLKLNIPYHKILYSEDNCPGGCYISDPGITINPIDQNMLYKYTDNYYIFYFYIGHQAVADSTPVGRYNQTDWYATPVISIQGKIIVSIYNPR